MDVEIPDKRLKLMSIDPTLLRPTDKTATREPFVTNPEALAVIPKNFESGP